MNDSTKTTSTKGSRPTHIAYWVRDREDKKSTWTRYGAAWGPCRRKGRQHRPGPSAARWTNQPPTRLGEKGINENPASFGPSHNERSRTMNRIANPHYAARRDSTSRLRKAPSGPG
jgi:hypothetical protein